MSFETGSMANWGIITDSIEKTQREERNGLQSCGYTAHAPLFEFEKMTPKPDSDSDISKGILETQDDYDKIKQSINFGESKIHSKID